MELQRNILVVSNSFENKKALLQVLKSLEVNIFAASTIAQAAEVLSRYSVLLVFSEERLTDGCYQDLLSIMRRGFPSRRLVLMLSVDAWDKYLHTLQLGVREVIHFPIQPMDIELALIRATREQTRAAVNSAGTRSSSG
jgi:DNA-binding NtrC family response regulator